MSHKKNMSKLVQGNLKFSWIFGLCNNNPNIHYLKLRCLLGRVDRWFDNRGKSSSAGSLCSITSLIKQKMTDKALG